MVGIATRRSRWFLAAFTGGLLAMASCTVDGDEEPTGPVGAPEQDDDQAGGDQSQAGADTLAPLQRDDRGPEVRALHDYLRAFGYFPNPELHEFAGWRPVFDQDSADPELFDDVLEQALVLYQRAHGLPDDGTANAETLALMARPRCGFPDYYAGSHAFEHGGVSNYVASGYKWNKNALTYSFLNYTGDLPVANIQADIRNSLNRWAAVTPLSFTAVGSGGDVQIGFYQGDHGDGNPFDGAYGVLAHAFYPTHGGTHFDDAENWTQNGSGIDFATVALHEFGHTIGLNHSADANAVMYASYSVIRRDLTTDDILGAQAIYGQKDIGWSYDGPIPGRYCTLFGEGADPHYWNDNYLCSVNNYGFQWSSAGPIAGMRCTQVHEGSEPAAHTWNDNYVCVPNNSPLQLSWSSAGPIAGKTCTQIYEPGDPHTWFDNYLCY